MEFSEVKTRPALVEQVLHQLRQRIMSGEWLPGDQLPPESKLAESMGVSRTVIREAMRSLRSQDLVEVSQGRRPRVLPPSPQMIISGLEIMLQRTDASLLHLIEIRRPLEGEIAALAAERISDIDLDRLEQTVVDLVGAEDLEQSVQADVRFHEILAEGTGNQIFQLVLATIAGPLWMSRRTTITRTGKERAADGHRLILQKIREHDAAGARAAMLEHLAMAEQDLRT